MPCRDAHRAALRAPALSPYPCWRGWHADAIAASVTAEPSTCPCPPAQPLMALPTRPPWTVQRPPQTSPSASPALESAQPSTALALALPAPAASGHRGSLRAGRGLESSSERPSPSLACQAWLQIDAVTLALRRAFTRSNPFNISWKNNSFDSSEKQLGGAAHKAKHLLPISSLVCIGNTSSHASWGLQTPGRAWLRRVLALPCHELQLSNFSQSIQ